MPISQADEFFWAIMNIFTSRYRKIVVASRDFEFRIHRNALAAGAPPRECWGSLPRYPERLSWMGIEVVGEKRRGKKGMGGRKIGTGPNFGISTPLTERKV